MRTRSIALALAVVASCSRSPEPTPAREAPPAAPATAPAAAPGGPAPTPGASAPSPGPPAPARAEPQESRPPPLAIPITAAVATGADGDQPLAGSAHTVVDPGTRFRVEVAVPLQDARLSLVDASGAMMAAEGSTEIGSTWARFTLAPAAPLAPGSDYLLRLDGAVAQTAHDPEGRAYAATTWQLRASGEKPRPPPKTAKPERRRRADSQ